jgi:hypothetical protein
VKRAVRMAWRRFVSRVGPYRCELCGQPLRRLISADLAPETARACRLAGTLDGVLGAGYVCKVCTKPGGWLLIE